MNGTLGGRRQDILDAAAALLAERGADALSVRAVAARAGVGASTLRHYFPVQRDLVAAALSQVVKSLLGDLDIANVARAAADRLTECLAQFLPPPGTGEAQTRAAAQALLTLGQAYAPGAAPAARGVAAAVAAQTAARVRGWIDLLKTQGALSPQANPEALTWAFTALLDGLLIGMASGGQLGRDQAVDVIALTARALIPPLPPNPQTRDIPS
ncbi:MAG: TetR family transcriptional regulator [Bifidobacteriaceae bacterium]|jgi:AcrR family transcriptional regulator|nr:TetR family transcriptional regulator [Bifidobacteriaceae bacterium]